MYRTLSTILPLLLLLFSISTPALAAVRTYTWSIDWVSANPDGALARPTIGINNVWPLPLLEVDRGDTLVVNVTNNLGNQSTSLHWHGLYQNGSTHMDGPAGVSQCEIPPGGSFVYNFTVNQVGTYWYHSHVRGQYPDGLRGPMLVHDPDSPYKGTYTRELTLSMSDWYHDEMPGLIDAFISVANPGGAEPVPDSALMNETQNLQIGVEPGTTYLVHLVNVGAFAGMYWWIEGHDFDVVEVDGVWTERATASQLYLAVAQRYSILLTTRNDTSKKNFAVVASMDEDYFDVVPDSLNPNVTSYLVYNSTAEMPEAAVLDEFDPFDDFTLVPKDGAALLPEPDHTVELAVVMDNLGDGANYAFFNNVTYVKPTVPTLYTALSAGLLATEPAIYGSKTNTFVLGYNEVVQIVLNNHDSGKHPFHLHGHAFQAVARGEDDSGDYVPVVGNDTVPGVPMRRDTFLVRPNGHVVLRYRADNPGVWLFHCHIEWHVDSGLVATIVEAPMELQAQNLLIPPSHASACAAASTPTPMVGNAAGRGTNLTGFTTSSSEYTSNKAEWLDLSGEPLPPAPLPSGFTAKGYVAMVFSVVAALVGLASIVWYGMGEMPAAAKEKGAVGMERDGSGSGSGSVEEKGSSEHSSDAVRNAGR